MVMKPRPEFNDVKSPTSSGAGVALLTSPRQECREETALRISNGHRPSEEARHSRPRRSPRHKRHAVTGETGRTRLRTSTDSSSNSSPAHSQSTTSSDSSSNGTVASSLLWALANSTTADSVAMAMIKDSGHEREHEDDDPPIHHKEADRVPQFHILHSVNANKSQLKGTFHSIFYPKQLLTSFVPILFLLLNVQSTSEVQLAEHALHLAQLGTSSKDERAIREALRVYHATVMQLRRRLSQPRAVLNDQVFAVVHLLRICETYSAISHDESGRRRHHEGIGQLLVAKGSKSHIKSFPLRISLEMYQQSQLWEMLATRQGSRTSTPEWAELNREDKCKWKLPQLTGFMLRLPRILQKVDELIAQEVVLEGDVFDVLNALKGFENGLRQWMNRFYVEHPEVPYWRVKMEKCPWMEPLGDGTTSTVFASAFDFAGTATAKAHQLFWMALLASAEASKDLADMLPEPLPPYRTFEEQDSRLLEETNEAADNLCMTAVYMSQPDNGVDSWIDACHSLQFASLWYEKSASQRKTTWCKTTISHIETRGIRAPMLSRRNPLPRNLKTPSHPPCPHAPNSLHP